MKVLRFLPIIGIALFIYLLTTVDLSKLFNVIITISPLFLLLAVLVFILQLMLQMYKWNMLLNLQQLFLPYHKLFIMHLKSFFYGVITPGRIGSFIKLRYISQSTGKDLGTSASSVVIDRFLDTIVLALMALTGSFIILNNSPELSHLILIVSLILIVTFFVLMNKKLTTYALFLFYKFLTPKKIKLTVKDSFDNFYATIPKKHKLILPFFVTIITWIITYTVAYMVALGLHINISFIAFITLYPIASFVGLIPITVAGLGTREAALVGIFSLYAIPPEQTIALSLIAFVISNILPALIGGILTIKDDTTLH